MHKDPRMWETKQTKVFGNIHVIRVLEGEEKESRAEKDLKEEWLQTSQIE